MTYLPSTDNRILSPMQPEFNRQILKMNMTDIVSIALEQKPPSLTKPELCRYRWWNDFGMVCQI